jgi:hypothetical protein
MIKQFLTLIILLFSFTSFGQEKSLSASKISEKITLDGQLSEDAWLNAEVAGDFTQKSPRPGEASTHKTEVKVIYDNLSIYLGVKCNDDPQHVSKILSQRDDFNANIDYFVVIFDTYNDDQNGFSFGVSSMGVQLDSKMYIDEESQEVNMVWNSMVQHTADGWQIEIQIPYSALRFPKVETQNWGINFFRHISRLREESTWSPIKPDFENFVAQCGKLTGVKGITPPLRLAFIPYVSGYIDHFENHDPSVKNWNFSVNGGMDIKYGINEAFTLDMTLVPDFGQVVFDNQVLNLSPFEIQFNENRQFFTEGTELFNKSGLFYSRRIGIQPSYSVLSTLLEDNEMLENIPSSTQLYNATKLSGRTKKGTGIGVFNGITAEQYATAVNIDTDEQRKVLVAPTTNYNVFVLDQNLKNNSSITLTNTNVLRSGSFYDANVTGLDFLFNTKSNNYYVKGWTALNAKFGQTTSTGYLAGVNFGKQKGNLIYNFTYNEESDTYDINDLGFNTNNNKRNSAAQISYRTFKPFWRINRSGTTMNIYYNRLYTPDVYTASGASLNFFNNSTRFHASGGNIGTSFTEEYDYFEPRSPGLFFKRPGAFWSGMWISSNYQKVFALDARINGSKYYDNDWYEYNYSISPRIRLTQRIFLIYQWFQSFNINERGYAVPFGTPLYSTGNIVFGERNRNVVENTINLRYTLTNRMGITFRLRHYRSSLTYNSFFDLLSNGELASNSMNGLNADNENVYNTNYNAFTIDLVYRWVFLPGSEINVVWKNSIFSSDKNVEDGYIDNFNQLFDYNALNSFSIKVLYWLDYQSLKRRNK